MGQYIDKAAVVAKIECLQNAHKDQLFRNLFTEEFIGGIEAASDQILSYINTLEVKEVDLEKETEHVKGDYEQADVAWNKDNNMKYIDTEKLKELIEAKYKEYVDMSKQTHAALQYQYIADGLDIAEQLIDSLRQEQTVSLKSKFMFPKFLYARTKDNKTIDVSYAPQSLDAMEYIRSDSLQQEQPEVDLEKEVTNWWNDRYKKINNDYEFGKYNGHYMANSTIISLAKHFFELGIKAQKG